MNCSPNLGEESCQCAMLALSCGLEQQAVVTSKPPTQNERASQWRWLLLGPPSSPHGYVPVRQSGDKNGSGVSKPQRAEAKQSASRAVSGQLACPSSTPAASTSTVAAKRTRRKNSAHAPQPSPGTSSPRADTESKSSSRGRSRSIVSPSNLLECEKSAVLATSVLAPNGSYSLRFTKNCFLLDHQDGSFALPPLNDTDWCCTRIDMSQDINSQLIV